MKFLDKITPAFLKKIDQKLLISAPLIWRTRIHFILFFSIVISALTQAGILLMPFSTKWLPSWYWEEHLPIYGSILLVFLVLYWGYTQSKYQLQSNNFVASFKTISCYVLGAFILSLSIAITQTTFTYRIATVLPAEVVESDSQLFNNGVFEGSLDELKERYHVEGSSVYFIENKIKIIRDSQKAFSPEGEVSYLIIGTSIFMLIFLVFVPPFLLLSSFVSVFDLIVTAFISFGLLVVTGISVAFNATGIPVLAYFVLPFIAGSITRRNKRVEILHYVIIAILPFFVISTIAYCSIFALEPKSNESTIIVIAPILSLCLIYGGLIVLGIMTDRMKELPH